jgi:hypothetical protein
LMGHDRSRGFYAIIYRLGETPCDVRTKWAGRLA